MQAVDQIAEIVRGAEPRRRRVIRSDLIAPGAAKRMLGHRQELHMREAHLGHVVGQLAGELGVGQARPPRTQVHLVDAHRAGQQVQFRPGRQPRRVGPLIDRARHHRRGGRRLLCPVGHRVGLGLPGPVRSADVVLVAGAGSDARHEQLPDARPAERPHRVRPAVPVVEVADHPDAACVGRPDGERGTAELGPDHRAEHLPELLVPALRDQVQIDLAERGQMPVCVVADDLGQAGVGDRDPVVRHRGARHGDRENTLVHVRHRRPAAAGQYHLDRFRQWPERPDGHPVRAGMPAQHRMRVMVRPGDQRVDLGVTDRVGGADAGGHAAAT